MTRHVTLWRFLSSLSLLLIGLCWDGAICRVVEDTKLEVVSFHFGVPDSALLARVKAADCRVMGSATTVAEALWLEARSVDIIVAQGYEAGGYPTAEKRNASRCADAQIGGESNRRFKRLNVARSH